MALKKSRALVLLLLGGAALLFGEVTFSGLHLSKENRLLFQATTEGPGQEEFRALFLADIGSGARRQLSFYPEDLQFLPGTGGLQIQNRFGLFRSDKTMENILPVDRFPSFLTGREAQNGKILPVLASPDGRYILHVEPGTPAYGDLLLFDTLNGKTETVSKRIEISLRGPSAEWSPDSRYFIYAKEGRLHYFSIDQYQNSRLLAETYRGIGDGGMANVRWAGNGDLYYIAGTIVYRITGGELFARTLYQDLIRIGRIAGKIPFEFDPNFDGFWIAPEGGMMLLNAGGGHIFLCTLPTGESRTLPYLYLPRNTRVTDLLWSRDDLVTLLAQGTKDGSPSSSIFRIDLKNDNPVFTKTADAGIVRMSLSPGEEYAALITAAGIDLRDYRTWATRKTIPYERPLGAAWAGKTSLIVGGARLVQIVETESDQTRFVCFSQPDEYGFRNGTVQVRTREVKRSYEIDSGRWTSAETFSPEPASQVSPLYRVYLETLPSGALRNIVMVRRVREPGTLPLFPLPVREYEAPPEKDDRIDFDNFAHGSRIRGREAALTFDLVDSAEGLEIVLKTLADYKIRATFFVGGDFIRSNPEAVKEIAASGHEIGSLFYAHFNMTDPRYSVTAEFIKQGLARNEDEYFSVTGKELSLLWHAPYYFVRSDIVRAAGEMGYAYIGRDVDSLDWAVKQDDYGTGRLYLSASDLVERIMEKKKPGSIISLRIGKPGEYKPGNRRDDYLFQKLDLLVNLLVARGYRIVPVSVLKDNAK